jgi:ABC-type microcin C transport system permease subunit YejE
VTEAPASATLRDWLHTESPTSQAEARLSCLYHGWLIHGSRITLYIVGLVALIAPVAGLFIGTVAGYVGGWVDVILMRFNDIFLAFPRLVLALPTRYRVVSVSASRSPGRWRQSHASCCSMNPHPRWMCRCRLKSSIS